MAGGSKLTIEEIAKRANVSIATVSRIINHKNNVKEETRQKVIQAMEELDFHPQASSGLSNKQSTTILMCVPEFRNPFFCPVIDGAQKAAYRHGYHLLFLQAKDLYTEFNDFAAILKKHSIAGVILLSSVTSVELAQDLSFHCPVVMCSEYCEESDIPFVSIDDRAAAEQATEYLISTGRRKIALMNSSLQNKYARHREKGYRQALEKAGLVPNENWIVHLSSVTYNLAMSHALHILRQPDRPDAFFAAADVFAVGIMKAVRKAGLRIPQDVAVIGFDNIELSNMTDPPLSTVEQPSYQIGYQACELLVEKMENPNAKSRQIILDTELIIRGSTSFNP